MPRSFEMSAEYGGSVEQVHRAFSDELYWEARLVDSGADHASLDTMTTAPDGGVAVVTTQVLRADRLPGVVTQFHRGSLSIRREETWTPVLDGQAHATVAGSIPGVPASLTGSAVLAPAEGGATLRFHATVEVNIPLVGGKLEDFVGSQLVELLIAEQRFTTQWLTENV